MVFDWFSRLFKKKAFENYTNKQTDKQTNELIPSELEKDSLQLGFAAGYTGRSIHDINSALSRIEATMPSRDWLLVQFEEQMRRHEEGEERRLQTILTALESLRFLSLQVPEPLRQEFTRQIDVIESKYKPSKKMKELVQLVKAYGEASFSDLSDKMGLSPSGFRNLVWMTLRRTADIETFTKKEDKKKKWLRYKSINISDTQTNVQTNASDKEKQSNGQIDMFKMFE